MTIEEAVNELDGLTMYVEHAFTEEHKCKSFEALKMAIEALEKQIPKKPIIITNLMTKHVSAHCSICDTDITYYSSGENYCHNCGKALKWE